MHVVRAEAGTSAGGERGAHGSAAGPLLHFTP